VTPLSVPLLICAALCVFLAALYGSLSLRLRRSLEERPAHYPAFALFAAVNGLFLAAFSLFMNAGTDTFLINLSNRLVIGGATLTVLLALHFLRRFFGDLPSKPLCFVWGLGAAFLALLCFDLPWFMGAEILETSRWYTGLEIGPGFHVWALFIVAVAALIVSRLAREIFGSKRPRKTICFLILASLLWLGTGMADLGTAVRLVDLPPLAWAGSILFLFSVCLVLVIEIEALHLRIASLYEEVIRDTLTGAFSRGYFEVRVRERLAALQRHTEPFFLVVFDLDDFKTINDRFGHPFGDRVLVEIVKSINHLLRPSDVIARIGGDEFAILLDHVENETEAGRILDRVLERLSTLTVSDGKNRVIPGCSFGMVRDAGDCLGFDELLGRADDAMYSSKARGKNVWTLYSPEDGKPR
jgi:diguanylate cyclase (GGDEF)-like protein